MNKRVVISRAMDVLIILTLIIASFYAYSNKEALMGQTCFSVTYAQNHTTEKLCFNSTEEALDKYEELNAHVDFNSPDLDNYNISLPIYNFTQ